MCLYQNMSEIKILKFTEKSKKNPAEVKRAEVNVKNKVASYMRQDIKMDRVTDENVTVKDVERKLKECDMRCFYCGIKMEISGRIQWTLDRKENHIAHTDKNTVVACLQCNLKKRRQETQRFIDGRRLISGGFTKGD